ncbi:hypothetical protein ACFWBG_29595 [Nocardia salmonicida]|uniref:hypothetical protein n=1 Tax=Nocardia salmonicida TaxID=53431 RepID=UPI00366B4853
MTVPAGTGIGVAAFALFAAIVDSNYPKFDPSPAFLVFAASGVLSGAAVAIGVVKRSARALGVATGLLAAALLVGLAGLMLR